MLRLRRGETGDTGRGLGMTGTAGGGPERVAPSSVEDLATVLQERHRGTARGECGRGRDPTGLWVAASS